MVSRAGLPVSSISVICEPSTKLDNNMSIGIKRKITYQSAVYFTKLSVYLAWSWPPPINASKWELTKYDIAWILSLCNVSSLVLALLAAMHVYQSNSVIITQTLCFFAGGVDYINKTLVCRVRRKRMQILIYEMEEYFRNPQPRGEIVLQCYLDRCSMFHVVITFINYATSIAMICGPLFFPQPLPTHAVYPFSTESGFGKCLAYAHQTLAGLQYSAAIAINCQLALLLWYAAARLEILAEEFNGVLSAKQFSSFVQKHQRILSYADEVSDIMCYVSLSSSAVCGLGTVMSCMQLVSNEPFEVKVQYGPMIMICLLNLFVCAWPAENLLKACDLMATAVYNASWTELPTRLAKDFRFVLRRSQQPVKVSIGGFLPILSLNFYAMFLSTAFSYFTTLRAVVAMNTDV